MRRQLTRTDLVANLYKKTGVNATIRSQKKANVYAHKDRRIRSGTTVRIIGTIIYIYTYDYRRSYLGSNVFFYTFFLSWHGLGTYTRACVCVD